MMKLLSWLDRCGFLNIRVWEFSGRSLFRFYGAAFLRKVILRHPIKTLRGMRRYQDLVQAGLPWQERYVNLSPRSLDDGHDSIVGVGFCLKPLDPPCPSGRFNHDCHFFESRLNMENAEVPECCAACRIRQFGQLALAKGCHFYVMTSAIDILHDVFLPALGDRTYKRGLFVLCRYSFDPFVLPLLMADMKYALLPFDSGDCRDYATWLKADVGIKEEQTVVAPENDKTIERLLAATSGDKQPSLCFKQEGNVFRRP